MTYELPKRTHLVHKPVELRNLSKKRQAELAELGKDWVYQAKYDGCNCIVIIKGGEVSYFSRTGEVVKSIDESITADFKTWARELGDYVLFCEAYHFAKPHSDINGMFRRQTPQPDLCLVWFDGVPLADFEAGYCPVRFHTRYYNLDASFNLVFDNDPGHSDRLFLAPVFKTRAALDAWIKTMREHSVFALDGAIGRDDMADWVAGAGKEGTILKLKDHISVDLRVTRVVEGKGKFAGMVGSLQVEYKGDYISIGGGTLTDNDRQVLWQNPQLIVGHIVEVHALTDSANGLLREPRYHRTRLDKTEPSY